MCLERCKVFITLRNICQNEMSNTKLYVCMCDLQFGYLYIVLNAHTFSSLSLEKYKANFQFHAKKNGVQNF